MVTKTHDLLWLVVEPTPLKNMSSSVGMMTFSIYEKQKMFQTTNQYKYVYYGIIIYRIYGILWIIEWEYMLTILLHGKDTIYGNRDSFLDGHGEPIELRMSHHL